MLAKIFGVGLIVFAVILSGCAKNEEQKVIDAVDTALYHLSQSDPDCAQAIKVLEAVGRQPRNPRYLHTLASAYACRGSFSELTLLAEVDTISADNLFLASLAQLSTSEQSQAESDEFTDLQTAIDLLLYAGEKTIPSASEQQAIFGNRHGANLNLQALYMIIVQLGRYARWYANTDATGAKGAGAGTNVCLFDYAVGPQVVATSHPSNACSGVNTGHPDLDYTGVTQTVAQKRLCQGAMLFNNLLDILENTSISSDSSLGDLSEVKDALDPYITLASARPDVAALLATLSQAECETTVAADDEGMQYYFATLFEGGIP
jgi:hypothetical protein